MRSDAKLGLALGILVTGFALAFCFPRHRAPTVIRAESIEETENSDVELLTIQEHNLSRQADPLSSEWNPFEEPAEQSGISTPLAVDDKSATTSNAIESRETGAETPLSDLIDVPTQSDARVTESAAATDVDDRSSAANALTIYVVKSGDTLSGIAQQTLGKSSRFLEIYELNRDLLQSPHDLKSGLLLRIPAEQERLLGDATISVASRDIDDTEPVESLDQPSGSEHTNSETNQAHSHRSRPQKTGLVLNEIRPQRVKTHLVQPGDTLSGIAIRYFGTVGAIERIREWNPHVTPEILLPGTALKLGP